MKTDNFNIDQWYPAESNTQPNTVTTPQLSCASTLTEDIETITSRIETTGTDITGTYEDWLTLGFALSDALGEQGRSYYHRISRFYPDYDRADCDRQYDKCLRAHGTGITIKTFFQKAKEAGIDIRTPKSAISATYAKSAQATSAHITRKSAPHAVAEIADIAETAEIPSAEPLPTFSDKTAGHLPEFLERIAAIGNSPQDTDILILGALTVISACLPHISGIYGQRTVYPNLFLFVTAKASSGKGRLTLCRHLVLPIHTRLRELYEIQRTEYEHRLAEYNSAGKKKVNLEKPVEPPQLMLFLPANSSATSVYQLLNENHGQGLMFETEGDTLANTFNSDYGNYSDGFRKAFHHETISYTRRKEHEYVNIDSPRLSVLLTGTPRQILNLISDAENGLFSRFAFYHLDISPVWNNVFDNSLGQTLDDYFRALGESYHDFYNILSGSEDLRFRLTPRQETDFNTTFSSYQDHFLGRCGDDFIASIRRLGVITFRIAMILTALRLREQDTIPTELICSDTDYENAKTIADTIIHHNARIFLDLPAASQPARSADKGSSKNTAYKLFLESLPEEFDRKTYISVAASVGLNPNSVDRIIRRWCKENRLENVSHGRYRKIC